MPLSPCPVSPEVIETHSPPEVTVAVHSQFEPLVETVNDPDPPAASIAAVAGATSVTTHGTPSWVIT